MDTVTVESIPISIGREGDGRWWADIESIPGVMAYGDSRESAIAAVRALALRVAADCIDHTVSIMGRKYQAFRIGLLGSMSRWRSLKESCWRRTMAWQVVLTGGQGRRPLLLQSLRSLSTAAGNVTRDFSIKLEEGSSMSSVLVPEEAASHLGAILLAFNREIFGSFLDEADELVESGRTASAVLIAGTVLEYLERSPTASLLPPEQRVEITGWRQLRNQVAHGSADELSVQQARQVIGGIRRILVSHGVPGYPRGPKSGVTPQSLKGKYAHVPTSSDEFLKRRREDLDLEDRK